MHKQRCEDMDLTFMWPRSIVARTMSDNCGDPLDMIECPNCHRQCVPRLWHYKPFLGQVRYLTTQHICPFCGSVMYETGGKVTPLGWGSIILFGGSLGCIVIAINAPGFDVVSAVASLIGLAVWAGIFYGLYRFVKRFLG